MIFSVSQKLLYSEYSRINWNFLQCCGSGSGRIRTFLVGSGSGRWDRIRIQIRTGLNKWLGVNFFGVFKSHKYLWNKCCLTFWFMKILFKAYFHPKNFQKRVGWKFFRVRFQDQDVFENRMRIQSKIVRIRNNDFLWNFKACGVYQLKVLLL
jgi:hypothetical protein